VTLSSNKSASMNSRSLIVRELGLQSYAPVWHAMQQFTDERDSSTKDEIWFAQHSPVFTLGLNSAPEHLLAPGDIPVVQVDRGGQVTYHGPGQLMIYPLLDIRRAGLGVRDLVTALEQSVVDLARHYGIEAASRADAPGVYVEGVKLASVGLRIRRGASFHGMALNVDVDTEPFSRIDPCGFANLEITDLARLGAESNIDLVRDTLLPILLDHLRMSDADIVDAVGELPATTH
jgi:lipoyl(octanoyl) transferase